MFLKFILTECIVKCMKQRTKEALLWTGAAISSLATIAVIGKVLGNLHEADKLNDKVAAEYSYENAHEAALQRSDAVIFALVAGAALTSTVLCVNIALDERRINGPEQHQPFIDVDCLPN